MNDDYTPDGFTPAYRDRTTYAVPRLRHIRSPQHRMHFGCLGAIIAFLVIAVGLSAAIYQYEYVSETSVVFTVKQLDDQASGNSHKYLVFTEVPGTHAPAEVFEDADAFLHGKWNSSNLWNYLQTGDTYRCTVYGYRNGVLSSYRNITVCSPLTLEKAQQYLSEWVKPVGS